MLATLVPLPVVLAAEALVAVGECAAEWAFVPAHVLPEVTFQYPWPRNFGGKGSEGCKTEEMTNDWAPLLEV